MIKYVGPGPLFYRQIRSPFAADPDWTLPAVPEPDAECFTMGHGISVEANAVLTFAFFDGGNTQIPGGTADGYEFYVTPRFAFGFGYENTQRGIVTKGDTATAMDLSEGWVMTVSGPQKHGLRLSNITAPLGAVLLIISVQELPR